MYDQNSSPEKVLLMGYYGSPNVGDELMLDTMLFMLSKFPNVEVTVVISRRAPKHYTRGASIALIPFPETRKECKCIAEKFDCIILGGGALIDDASYKPENDGAFSLGGLVMELAMDFIQASKTFIAFCVSTNRKLVNQQYVCDLKYVVSHADYFSVRDLYSKSVLEQSGIDISRVTLSADLVYGHPYFVHNPIPKHTFAGKHPGIRIGIGWACVAPYQDQLKKMLTNLCDFFIQNDVFDFTLSLFPSHVVNGRDILYYEQAKSKLLPEHQRHIEIPQYTQEMSAIVEFILQQDMIISIKYHFALIAGMLNQKCAILSIGHPHYKNKMTYLQDRFCQFTTTPLSQFDMNIIPALLSSLFIEKESRAPMEFPETVAVHQEVIEVLEKVLQKTASTQ